jgi:hypothetical protein
MGAQTRADDADVDADADAALPLVMWQQENYF